jgi:BirA family biotin operon repressor/biotin-[acetyl-CoA-carboxylase] ligase
MTRAVEARHAIAAAGGDASADGGLARSVFALLHDGQLHAGSQLAAHLQVSRTAVWKAVASLRLQGVRIDSVARRGYRAHPAYVPLQAALIAAELPPAVRAQLRNGEVWWSTDSTNARLLAVPPPEPGRFDFALAEHQSAGRGRRGRRWFAVPGSALCLSVGWQYGALPIGAGALSLAVGVGLWRVCRRFGVQGVQLKWPNDLVIGNRKLCGVLLELRAESAGAAQVVVGIGLNVRLDPAVRAQIAAAGTDCIDLHDAGVAAPDRNAWAAAVIADTVLALQTFAAQGFAPFAADWRAADVLDGCAVTVHAAQGSISGQACGIDADGALCVRTGGGLQRFTAGDVSVRSQS